MNINLRTNTQNTGGNASRQPVGAPNMGGGFRMERNAPMMQRNKPTGSNFQRGGQKPAEDSNRNAGTVKVLDWIISISIFMIFFGFPIFFIGKTFQGLTIEKNLFFYFWLLLGLVSWVTKGVILREMKIARTPLDIPIFIFLAVSLLATVFSVDRWHSFWGFFGGSATGLINITALMLAYFLVVSNFDKKRFKLVIYGLVGSIAIVTIWTVLAILGVQFLPKAWAVYAPLNLIGSLTSAGTFFAISIPILLSFIFSLTSTKDGKKSKLALVVGGIIILVANLFILGAIFGFINKWALLLGVFAFLIFIISRIVRPSSNWTWLGFAVFIAVMVIIFSGGFKVARVSLPIEVSPKQNVSWEIVKHSMKENFFLGSGPSTYGYDFAMFKPETYNLEALYTLRFYQSTSILFEGIATIGALGTIAFIILILSFLSVTGYLLSIDKEKNKIWSLGLAAASVTFIINAFTNQVDGVILTFGSLVAILSIAMSMNESVEDRKYLDLSLKASPKFALALAFIFMVVTAGVVFVFVYMGQVLVAEIYVGKGAREQQISEEGSIMYLVSAIGKYDKEGRYFTKLGQEYMVLANMEMLKTEGERDLNKIGNYLNRAIDLSKRGVEKMPNDVLAVESLAQIYENSSLYVSNSLGLAEENYLAALELEPNNPIYMLKIGQIKVYDANSVEDETKKEELMDEAIEWFEKAVAKKKNLPEAYYHLALSKELTGDLDAAIDNMTKAMSLNRQNINFVFNLARLYQARKGEDDVKIAEALYKQILGVNDKEVNTHFSLANLYEQTNRNAEAIEEYKKVVELLPDSSQQAKDRIQQMIENLEAGKSNIVPVGVETPATPAIEETPASVEEAPAEENPEAQPTEETPVQ